MNRTEELDKLFVQWNQKRMDSVNFETYNDIFIKDGIVDYDIFKKQDIKVLFISNEANIGTDFNSKDSDIRYDFKVYNKRQKDEYAGKIRERVCCLYQVVINDFSNKDAPYRVAKNFAFMNLNKTGGGSTINDRISTFCDEFKDEIKKEIDIICPDIIIWLGCNTFDNDKIRVAVGIEKHKGQYYYNNTPVIRMWHTSYYQSKREELGIFNNKITDKLSKKLYDELFNIGWYKFEK